MASCQRSIPTQPLVVAIDNRLARASSPISNETKNCRENSRPEALLSYEHQYCDPIIHGTK
jgi:hypothetical protein